MIQKQLVLYEKGVLKNFTEFTGKHLCQSLFFNKIAGLSQQLIKNEALAQVFSREFCENFKNTLFTKHLWAPACDNCRIFAVKIDWL